MNEIARRRPAFPPPIRRGAARQFRALRSAVAPHQRRLSAGDRAFGQRTVPDRMQIAIWDDAVIGHPVVAAAIVPVARMERLVNVAREMDEKGQRLEPDMRWQDRKSTRLNSSH